jgi:hypothetical protein
MSIRKMEKSHLKGRILGKPFLIPHFLNGMKEVTLERHPFYVRNVEKSPFILVAFANRNQLVVEENHMFLSNVGNPSQICVLMKTMEELPLQRNSMYASNVEKPLVLPVT